MTRLPDLHHRTVILDIDGTLLIAGENKLDAQTVREVARMKLDNDVYLLSNKRMPIRDESIAQQLGVPFIVTKYRKPDRRTVRDITIHQPLTVVGDKVLTDGLLAYFARGEFIRVKRLVSPRETLLDRFYNRIDDGVRHVYWHFKLLRAQQWLKNILIFAPLFFAGEVFNRYTLHNVINTFFVFCLLASAGYIVNDSFDAEHDRAHRHKHNRPIASGEVSVRSALMFAAVLVIAAVALLITSLPTVLPVALAYLASSIVYSAWLKFVPIAEMLIFIWFYLARMLGGGIAAEVPTTAWLTLSVVFIALFLVVAKRYAQCTHSALRPQLQGYSALFLQTMLCMTAGLVIAFYALYTVLGTHSSIAVYSVLPVIAGIMRLLYLSFMHGGIEYPEHVMVSDPGVVLSGFVWLAVMGVVVYPGML